MIFAEDLNEQPKRTLIAIPTESSLMFLCLLMLMLFLLEMTKLYFASGIVGWLINLTGFTSQRSR